MRGVATQPITRLKEEEYLALERSAECRHEFVDGGIFAMAGGSLRHSRLAVNWVAALVSRLQHGACGVFSSDARVRTPATGSFVYPDVSVVCGPPQLYGDATDILTNPTVVIEILSPSTAGYDRGRKFALYREIVSMEEYILVHTESAQVEHFARQSDESWIFREYRGMETVVTIRSIDWSVRLGDVYDGVFELPA
jgi:Uma2 family endonuclease